MPLRLCVYVNPTSLEGLLTWWRIMAFGRKQELVAQRQLFILCRSLCSWIGRPARLPTYVHMCEWAVLEQENLHVNAAGGTPRNTERALRLCVIGIWASM